MVFSLGMRRSPGTGTHGCRLRENLVVSGEMLDGGVFSGLKTVAG
jgi:hypothetical protein